MTRGGTMGIISSILAERRLPGSRKASGPQACSSVLKGDGKSAKWSVLMILVCASPRSAASFSARRLPRSSRPISLLKVRNRDISEPYVRETQRQEVVSTPSRRHPLRRSGRTGRIPRDRCRVCAPRARAIGHSNAWLADADCVRGRDRHHADQSRAGYGVIEPGAERRDTATRTIGAHGFRSEYVKRRPAGTSAGPLRYLISHGGQGGCSGSE